MLSSQAPQLSTIHRRQNSTPSSLYPIVKVGYKPAHFTSQHFHRRGRSLDMVMESNDISSFMTQDNSMVSITNPGPESQQTMRAAQMPASSRPGPDNLIKNQEADFNSQWGAATKPGILDSCFVNLGHSSLRDPGDPLKLETIDLDVAKLSGYSRPSSMSLEIDQPNQPQTPSNKRAAVRYPMTPLTETRHKGQIVCPSLQASSGRRGPPIQIKTEQFVPMRRGGSCQGSFSMNRQLSDAPSIPSPPCTAPLHSSTSFDVLLKEDQTFMNAAEFNLDFGRQETYNSSNYSPTTNHGSPSVSSFRSSPDIAPMSLFGEITCFPSQYMDSHQPMGCTERTELSPRRRNSALKDSSSNKPSSDSETSFNPMDYMHNDTGITEEEINAHIQGPDADGKYYCLHEDCLNRQSSTRKENVFGRKENIRAHVQTHLEDRRFECDVCYKRFVRPNDLKRHWNIHLNKRDFKCVCNAAFNRHDALKRHRERSEYCESGGKRGIPGSPKKEEKKRGRPKKIAPTETDERRERKAFIRRQVLKKKQASAASSVVSSHPSPPPDFDFPELQRAQPTFGGYSPAMGSFTPPASPGNTADEIFPPRRSPTYCTPKAHSMSPPPTRGSLTASLGLDSRSIQENDFSMGFFEEPLLPGTVSVSKSNTSQYGTPPELDIASSSPSAPLVDFTFTDSLNQSSQTTEDTAFLDDIVKKATNESFDSLFSFIDADNGLANNSKSNDMEIFQDALQDDFYWAQT